MGDLLCELFYDRLILTDEKLIDMWNYDKDEFISVMFYVRSHRKKIIDSNYVRGLGNKKLFYQIINWMSYNKLDELKKLLIYIPYYGCWKDLLFLLNTPIESDIIKLFSDQLQLDYNSYCIGGLISLASKWVPNENSSFDKKTNIYGKIADTINISRKSLRKDYLVPLRKYLGVVEQIITDKNWNHINYLKIPKLSLKLHTNKFIKNDEIRFNNFLNRTHISYIDNLYLPITMKLILSNKNLNHKDLKNSDSNINILYAIDTSGSMQSFQIQLASSFFVDNYINHWIPFTIENNINNTNINETNINTTDINNTNINNTNINNTNINNTNINNTNINNTNINNTNINNTNINETNINETNINETNINETNINETNNILKFIDTETIINYLGNAYDIEECVKIAKNNNYNTLVIFSNINVDILELKNYSINIIYWVLNNNMPKIINDNNITIIEGYDINLYLELKKNINISKNTYKNEIINKFKKNFLIY
jgi:uncharacterized protein YjbI with pentapeptide repeats